ncbi:microcystin-dependent protein [Caulobacter ginsengisoli]|uniref:Microcystin-dependent protein n=1 Tax=Caulobacter ginsengisoli TaxID=400775 RepID=A0ABU0ING0_9CAUL|nr:tail fiber protein [Caulobacter ginsengisoli]MDQ0463540.1 microcystin-dependent protein [Caulobacter ginsengisoli]
MSQPFMGEIKIISWNFSPKGWAFCNGQFLPINQNQALFSILGTTYGGNGQTTFALPDFRGRTPIHQSNNFIEGQAGGQEFHTVTLSEMPAHNHFMMASNVAVTATAANATPAATKVLAPAIAALQGGGTQNVNIYGNGSANTALNPGSSGNQGGSQPHENRQPFLVLNFIIALQGIFPSHN